MWKPPNKIVTPERLMTELDPGTETKAVLILSRLIHEQDPNHGVATSWKAQEQAMEFCNKNGLSATLNECLRLDPNSLDD